MTLRHPAPNMGMAGLQRAARLAGESFGHEDISASPGLHPAALTSSLWWFAAALAGTAGLVALSLR